MISTIRVACSFVLVLSCASVLTAQGEAPPAPSPNTVLESVVRGAPERRSNDALLGLRKLKDPSLRALFSALVSSEHASRRRQGVLGLAELENPPRMNPLLLSRISDPLERAALVGEGLSSDLIGAEQVEQMLAWPSLEPYVELSLRARLSSLGKGLDTARVSMLAEKGGVSSELLAGALLAQSGDSALFERASGRLLGLTDPERGAMVGLFLEAVRREKLTAASSLLPRLAFAYSAFPSAEADILRTWVRVSPESGLAAWRKKWEGSPALADRLRLAMVALDASDLAPPELFSLIESSQEEPALAAMGRLGATLARREPALDALRELIALRYVPVESWIIDRAKSWDEATAQGTYRAFIDAWAARPPAAELVSESVLEAGEALMEKDRAFLASSLSRACEKGDVRMSHAFLMMHLATGSSPVWDVAAPPRWPDKQSEGLELLVRARSAEAGAFPKTEWGALEAIATGAGAKLPYSMRAQAAWMLLKARGQTDATLARLLAGKE